MTYLQSLWEVIEADVAVLAVILGWGVLALVIIGLVWLVLAWNKRRQEARHVREIDAKNTNIQEQAKTISELNGMVREVEKKNETLQDIIDLVPSDSNGNWEVHISRGAHRMWRWTLREKILDKEGKQIKSSLRMSSGIAGFKTREECLSNFKKFFPLINAE